MSKKKRVTIAMCLPVLVQLDVEPIIYDGENIDDFDVKDVQLSPFQMIGVSDVNEALDEDTVNYIIDKLKNNDCEDL